MKQIPTDRLHCVGWLQNWLCFLKDNTSGHTHASLSSQVYLLYQSNHSPDILVVPVGSYCFIILVIGCDYINVERARTLVLLVTKS